ncbi:MULTISPECIES: carbohydrate ABC transporter permease [Pseudothermotoga]|uniref:Binding-protein-dependent transport systems inner membrane component n=1 Tax=Pseudothermotoga lettingae (strain ATCC BAA-301 / DSM 14385 / NBRC 107922 / TMO) TaxID=416591 RepID=A8F7U4_PSELT|nr:MULTISPECIES: sugar ABC transporter permease [Pseudothermotoga]ABV34228.1 binding-protein-dependent transport systems inner membrane component [Pseudothermotoga lettingae TMO]KUK21474.1 MAG: Binding-protein-dependent transport systems inner membrane component [Pseudothermotoga lettingae]MDI3494499.1 multiple sugar transport system permease protein [Pseudothermotoga sp.]MDK2884833.1 multiple sugar transport system permease protein [Pseudothermotoga sp.]GLI48828.1 sugar ABC transporter permea
MLRRKISAYFFVAPATIIFIIFTFVPVVMAFVMAFQNVGIFGNEWVGFENFKEVFQNSDFWIALRNTMWYASFNVLKNISVALMLASLLAPLSEKAQSLFRAIYYLPTVTATVVIGIVWGWLLNYSFGPINTFLTKIGAGPVPWLVDPSMAMWSIILTDMVIAPGSGVILYLAAINNIPKSLYEAAELDGASGFYKWLKITIPLVTPTTLYLTVVYTIAAISVFDKIYVLTGGGPGNSTITLVYLIYTTAFRDFNYGLASAISLVFFSIAVVISIFQFKSLSRSYEWEG